MTTKEELRAELGAASVEIKQVADERDEWKTRAKLAQRKLAEEQSECAYLRIESAAEQDRANELRAEVERLRADQDRQSREIVRLRAELDGREQRYVAAQEQRNELRAEVERLRALAEERWQLADERMTQFAAANALLERLNVWNEKAGTDAELRTICSDVFDYLAGQAATGEHPSEPSTDTLQQQVEYWRNEALAANELLRSVPHPESSAFPAWAEKADAHLAGQANPTLGHPGADEVFERLQSRRETV